VFDDVIGVEEGEQGPAVAFEEAELFGERVDLIEIEPEIKDLILETMHLRREPVMHDVALVEGGIRHA
jgi:hypothetical protein